MKILLLTDSAADLQPEHTEGRPIRVYAEYIYVGDKSYREFYDLTPDDFWEILKNCDEKTYPTTSAVPPSEILEEYKKARADGYTHVIVTQVSSTASGMYQNACIARDMLEDEGAEGFTVRVVDTLTYSTAYGHYVLKAADMVEAGKSFEEIGDWLEERCRRTDVLFGAYNMKYMIKSGRISGMAAFAGEKLGLRPVICTCNGHPQPVELRVRGDGNVAPAIVRQLKERADKNCREFTIIHADIPLSDIEKLEQLVSEAFPGSEITRYKLGSTITANTGPHTLALTYFAAESRDVFRDMVKGVSDAVGGFLSGK